MDTGMVLRVIWQLGRLRARDRWTRLQVEAEQSRALARLRAHAYARSPFYRRFHAGLADRPLAELPVLTKALLMEHFDELVTDPAIRRREIEDHLASPRAAERFRDRYWVTATSGSTGRPGLFLYDGTEWTTVLTSLARAHEWAGVRVSLTHRMRMASVASTTSWHLSTLAATTLDSWWMPAIRLAASDPTGVIVERLNPWQPEMLVIYASLARVLADEQLAGRLRIRPHLVFTSSEVLTVEARRLIEAAWGRQPFNQYAATEAGGMAAECDRHAGLHLFEDQVIVEVVDQDYRPVPPGVYGDRVLVTVLFGRTQPLIRYELTDSLCLAQAPCACGRPFGLVEAIQGRTEDVLHLPAVGGGEAIVHPLVFERVLDAVPCSGWQVIQEPDGLSVLLSGVDEAVDDAALTARLQHELTTQGVAAPLVRLQHVPTIPRGAGGKAPLIRSSSSPSFTTASRAYPPRSTRMC